MNKKKVRFDMLVERASISIERILNQKSTASIEVAELKKIIDELALMNEADFYNETEDLPVKDSKQKYLESSKMFEIILELFALELETQSKKLALINGILK
jgi:hypothetical protein